MLETSRVGFRGNPRRVRDVLGNAFYPLYRRVFDDESTFVADVERKLAESRMTDTVEMYVSWALGTGVVFGLALWFVGTVGAYLAFATGAVEVGVLLGVPVRDEALLALVNAAKVPVLVFLSGVVFGTAGFTLGFGSLLAVPYYRSSEREREINMLLSDAVSYMYSLSIGGLNQVEILHAMAAADDTYGEVSREFQVIVQETEYFDTDYRSAIRTRATQTPSDELGQFLTDMLSIINSGGDMEQFLDDKKDKHLRTAKRQQETVLETLELFGEMYMTVSLFPLLLIVVLVVMSMLGNADRSLLFLTVYGLMPTTSAVFLILVAAFKWDDPGEGYIRTVDDARRPERSSGLFDLGLVEAFVGPYRVFDRIRSRELRHDLAAFLRRPHLVFRDHPAATLAVTVPVTAALFGVAFLADVVPTTWDALVARPVWGTFVLVYLPAYVVGAPYAAFRLWNVRSRRAVLRTLSDDLRKLSSANDTGLTLLESVRLVGETSTGKLAAEFEEMYAKVKFGSSLKEALVSFNNDYRIPRLARITRLVAEAQEASNHITDVLRTAAQASENQDDLEREQRSRTRMQVVIIVITYFTLLAVIAILKTQFLDTMARLAGETGGAGGFNVGAVKVDLLSLLFFHAVTIQAAASGLVAGYIRESELTAGVKYALVLMAFALGVWTVVG